MTGQTQTFGKLWDQHPCLSSLDLEERRRFLPARDQGIELLENSLFECIGGGCGIAWFQAHPFDDPAAGLAETGSNLRRLFCAYSHRVTWTSLLDGSQQLRFERRRELTGYGSGLLLRCLMVSLGCCDSVLCRG